MLKRLVKMTFRADAVAQFRHEVFEESKDRIRAFPGCRHMELLQDVAQPHVLFTLSLWESEAALAAYRASDLFRETWAKTKVLFAERPEAWSTEVLDAPASA